MNIFTHRQPDDQEGGLFTINYQQHGLVWFSRDTCYSLDVALTTVDLKYLIVVFVSQNDFFAVLFDLQLDTVVGDMVIERDLGFVYVFRHVMVTPDSQMVALMMKKIPRAEAQSLFTLNVYEIHLYEKDCLSHEEINNQEHHEGGFGRSSNVKFVKRYHQDQIEGMMIEGPAIGYLPGQASPTYCIANMRDAAHLGEDNIMLAKFDMRSHNYTKVLACEDPQISWLDMWYYNIHGVVANPQGTLITVCYETTISRRSAQHRASILLFDAENLQLLREVFSPVSLVMLPTQVLPTKGCYINFLPQFSPCGSRMALLRTELQPDRSIQRHVDVYRMPWTCHLQKLCRSTILNSVREGQVHTLPLPNRLLRYLTFEE